MSEIRWIKIAIGMCDDEKMKLIDFMPERDIIHYIWVRLLIQAGKTNAAGNIFLSENIAYSSEMLSIIFNRPVEIVELALRTLVNLKMIEIDENNFIYISNWEKHQNIEGMEKIREQTRKRVENYRKKNKSKENPINNNSFENCNVTETEQNKKENKIKIEKENKTKRENITEIENMAELQNKIEAEEKFEAEENIRELENKIEKDEIFQGKNKKEFDIMEHLKKISKKFVGTSISAINLAVSIHGERNVKLAIDKAVEVNILTMNYINGILKNWQREGYPANVKNSLKSAPKCKTSKQKVLSFNNFEPREYDYDVLEKGLLGW